MYLQYEDKDVFSRDVIYNDNSQDITTLFSGLLKEKVVDKICANGTFSTPEIPEELKNCVRNKDIVDDGFLRSFEFTLTNPENEETTTLVSAPVVEDGQCPVSSKKHFPEETQINETKVGLIVFFCSVAVPSSYLRHNSCLPSLLPEEEEEERGNSIRGKPNIRWSRLRVR